jgi:hypothetical protein
MTRRSFFLCDLDQRPRPLRFPQARQGGYGACATCCGPLVKRIGRSPLKPSG